MIRKCSVAGKLDLVALERMTQRHKPTDIKDQIRQLHRRGHAVRYIADHLHVTAETVAKVIEENAPK